MSAFYLTIYRKDKPWFHFHIVKEKPGVISEGPCWVCTSQGYLYTHDSLFGLLWTVISEWKNDRHLVG